MSQPHLHQATSRRRKKNPLITAGTKRKKKKIRYKQQHRTDSDSDSNTSPKRAKTHDKNDKNRFILFIVSITLVFILFFISISYIEYSKRLERQFELQKYNHEKEMKKIALERAKIDAELTKLQQNLKEIEYNKEALEVKQRHEIEMQTMKFRHKKEFETLKIEGERESEDWTLKMQKMKSMLAESDKKLAFEQEHNEMKLKHETERIKLEYNNKLEEVKYIDENKRILSELKITKSSELYNNALNILNKQVQKEKEALELKRKECFIAKQDERDSWWIISNKYGQHAKEVCGDYKIYRNDVNKLIDHLSSLTQERTTKLIDDTTYAKSIDNDDLE
eukprot:498224_1